MKTNILMIASLSLLFVSCASQKQKFLDTQAVSMNHTSLPKTAKLKDLGPVRGIFCMDSLKQEGEFGMMDEAVKDAHAKTGADFITQAAFYLEGSCVSVEGQGQQISKN